MEDLLCSLSNSHVSEPSSSSTQHPHFALYKVKRNKTTQEKRRKRFLELQKLKRFDFVNHARHLATNDWTESDEIEGETCDDDENAATDDMDWDSISKKPPKSYKDQLMLSEWLIEVPYDFETKWLMKLCPEGKRSFVVASLGETKVYTRSGYLLSTFPSNLPGGNRKQRRRHHVLSCKFSSYCILDCIYNELNKTYYILDVMCWNSHPLFDSETEFRFFWLEAKMMECPSVQKVTSDNPYKFIGIPHYPCDVQSIRKCLWSTLPFPCKLDGLLFYHKETHYTSGVTPLVGWLKAYMVPEILNIKVPDSLCADKPSQYINLQKHIPEFYQKHQNRKVEENNAMHCDEK